MTTALTVGKYQNEPDACADLNRRLTACKLWIVMDEVWGEQVHPRLDTEAKSTDATQHKGVIIDRLLLPTREIVKAGWIEGAIGIEAKKSGLPMGRRVCQAMDYTRCVFRTHEYFNHVMLKWVFLWPAQWPTGDLASVMANYRVGTVAPFSHNGLVFTVNSTHVIVADSDRVSVKLPTCGHKVGSR